MPASRWLGVQVVAAALAATTAGATGVAVVGLPGAPSERVAALGAAPERVPTDLPSTPVEPTPSGDPAGAGEAPAAPAPATAPGAPAVAPLGPLQVPDLVVTLRAPLRPDQVAALTALPDVTGVAVVDSGVVPVAGGDARLLGVDPSQFRAFTPQETAGSDLLWQAVARGEVVPSYGLARERSLPLGGEVVLGSAPERVGGIATLGLRDVDLVTDRETARAAGALPDSVVVVAAPKRKLAGLKKAVLAVTGQAAEVVVLRPEAVAPSKVKGKPRDYRELYIDSARYCPGLSWTVLAAIGQVESGHGRNLGPSSAGALGPMQFLPSTWAAYGIDGDRDGVADIMNPFDAVPSAAGYLCRFGANKGPDGLYDAIFAYNHADWYVRKVLGLAAQYR